MTPNHPPPRAATRPRGHGSVFQRKDGRWVAQVPNRGKKKIYYCSSQDEAEAVRVRASAVIRNGYAPPDVHYSVTDLVHDFQPGRISPQSPMRRYLPHYLGLIKQRLGTESVLLLQPETVRDKFFEVVLKEEGKEQLHAAFEVLWKLFDYGARLGAVPAQIFTRPEVMPLQTLRTSTVGRTATAPGEPPTPHDKLVAAIVRFLEAVSEES